MALHKRWLLVGLLLVGAVCRPVSAAEKTLYQKTSSYSTIVVTEDDKGLRSLWFDGGYAPQSMVKVGDPDHVEYDYLQAMFVALAVVEEPKRVLVVGLGGGTIPNFLHKHYPRMKIDVVEIDPVVVEVAKKFFGFREDALLQVTVEDGRRIIEKCKDPYDIIFLDAYGPDNIPYDLTTKEFLSAVRRALKPQGVAASNIWASACNPLNGDMVRTYQEVFQDLSLIDLMDDADEILLARPGTGSINREDLARRAAGISKAKALRFDLGQWVRWGFQPVNGKTPGARVLLDKDKKHDGADPRRSHDR